MIYKNIHCCDFYIHNSESCSWIIVQIGSAENKPRSRLNSGGTWRSNNSLITSYSWLTTPNVVCFECVLAVHIGTTHPVWLLWSGISRGDCGRRQEDQRHTYRWQESHIKATSLENNRRGGNRIGADLNWLETVRQECVYQLSQS